MKNFAKTLAITIIAATSTSTWAIPNCKKDEKAVKKNGQTVACTKEVITYNGGWNIKKETVSRPIVKASKAPVRKTASKKKK